jgi:acyl-CoA thioesterase
MKILETHLARLYDRNPFVRFLQLKVESVSEGSVVVTMPVSTDVHTNLYDIAHGGALAGLADTAMGIACASMGKRTVTLDISMNYIRAAGVQPVIKAHGKVVHNGKTTMVVEVDIVDAAEKLIAKSRATFFVVGKFEDEN